MHKPFLMNVSTEYFVAIYEYNNIIYEFVLPCAIVLLVRVSAVVCIYAYFFTD